MQLLASAESEITKDKKGENVPHLEVFELVLLHCNLVIHLFQKKTIWWFIRNFTNKPYLFKNI